MTRDFSVLVSLYDKEDPFYFQSCLESLVNQTLTPSEVVVVLDGPVRIELRNVLEHFVTLYPNLFKVYPISTNVGLGNALNFGLQFIQYDIVARMDTDDISAITRFEKQITFLEENAHIDVLGSNIAEFLSDISTPIRYKQVPEYHADIQKRSKLQNPLNHMTVVFKTASVRKVGGYRHAPFFEDYDLWLRMLKDGMIFHNIQEPLVFARVGNDMIGKRHGWKYCKHEIRHFTKMYRSQSISLSEFLKAICLRVPLRIIPKGVLSMIYNLALRKKI